jgi:hypothetical protein
MWFCMVCVSECLNGLNGAYAHTAERRVVDPRGQ